MKNRAKRKTTTLFLLFSCWNHQIESTLLSCNYFFFLAVGGGETKYFLGKCSHALCGVATGGREEPHSLWEIQENILVLKCCSLMKTLHGSHKEPKKLQNIMIQNHFWVNIKLFWFFCFADPFQKLCNGFFIEPSGYCIFWNVYSVSLKLF